MSRGFSQRSKTALVGVHPKLVAVVTDALQTSPYDFMVVQGVRSREQCMVNYGKGRTASQIAKWGIPAAYAKPGEAKVTWLANPFNSLHCVQADGYGHAVDLLPEPYDWKDIAHFKAVAAACKAAAAHRGVRIVWGGDWSSTKDYPHIELA